MMKGLVYIVALSLWCLSARGQSMTANYPTIPVVQINPGVIGNTSTFNQPVTAGNLGVVAMTWYNDSAAPSVSSSRCTSWTQLDYVNPGGTTDIAYVVYGCIFTSSGSETVTITEAGAQYPLTTGTELPPACSITEDGTPAHAYVSGSAPPSITTPNITTTLNNDCIFSIIGGISSQGADWVSTAGWLQDGIINGDHSAAMAFTISGAPGTYAATFANATGGTGNGAGTVAVIVSLASNAIAINSPSTIPDGALSTLYNYTMQASGGVGSYTWSITSGSLESGLSLNTSTGAITGTPTHSSQSAITFKVTDGTNSATKSVNLKVAGALNSIGYVGSTISGSTSGQASLAINVANANDTLLVAVAPILGWYISLCTDTLGTGYKLLGITNMNTPALTTGGGYDGPIAILGGIAPSTGSNEIVCGGGNDAGIFAVSEFTNAPFLLSDNFGATVGNTASPATVTSNSLTTLVPNELIYGFGYCWVYSVCTMTSQSPLYDVGPNYAGDAAYLGATSVTGYTASFAETLNSTGQWGITLVGLRPGAGAVVGGGRHLAYVIHSK